MRRGVRTPEIQEQERQKSRLLLQGQLAKESGRHDEAARFFGEAAQLEEALAAAYGKQGITEQVGRRVFSAAGCWSQAGNFLRALELCDRLINDPDTPTALRARALAYARTLRERRNRLWAEISQAERDLMAA
jgi:tetratricopeptide (TPR) repeat protein